MPCLRGLLAAHMISGCFMKSCACTFTCARSFILLSVRGIFLDRVSLAQALPVIGRCCSSHKVFYHRLDAQGGNSRTNNSNNDPSSGNDAAAAFWGANEIRSLQELQPC